MTVATLLKVSSMSPTEQMEFGLYLIWFKMQVIGIENSWLSRVYFQRCEFLSVVSAPFVADNIVSVAYSAPFSPLLAIEDESNTNSISQTPAAKIFLDLDYKASVLAISLGADDSNVRHQSCRICAILWKMLWQHILSLEFMFLFHRSYVFSYFSQGNQQSTFLWKFVLSAEILFFWVASFICCLFWSLYFMLRGLPD